MLKWHMWIIIGIFLFIVEIFTPGFILGAFGVSCLVAAVFAYIGSTMEVQFIAFSVTTLLVFMAIRPIFIKYFYQSRIGTRTNVDGMVGQVATVTETIVPGTNKGRVKLYGDEWVGVSSDGLVLEKGSQVIVTKVDGTKMFVKSLASK